MRYFLFLSLSFNLLLASATDVIEWQKSFGGDFNDKVTEAINTSDGGVLFVGYTESNGAGGKDAWAVKLTSAGDVMFNKTFGSSQNDYFTSVTEDDDGAFVACGQKQNVQTGYLEAWTLRFDRSGELDWEKTYAVSEKGHASFISYNAEEKAYTLVAAREEKSDHDMNIWWLKLNKKGSMILQSVSKKRFLNDEALSAIVTSDGSTVTAGYICDKFNDKNVYVAKLDKRGTELWSQSYGGAKNDYAVEILPLSGDRYFVCANTENKGQGSSDAWVMIIDKNGRILAKNTVGGIGEDVVMSAVAVPGGFMLAGKSDTKSKGKTDNWLVKLDESLAVSWDYTFGNVSFDELTARLWSQQTKLYIVLGNSAKPANERTSVYVYKINENINDEANSDPKASASLGMANSPAITISSPMVRRGFKTVVS